MDNAVMNELNSNALPVTPAVVQWARERSGFSLSEASERFKKIAAWETGEAGPSYAQLEQMSDLFKTPLAVFFFPEPPTLPSIEQSFRTLSPDALAEIPRSVRMLLRKAQAMQLNVAELHDGKRSAVKNVQQFFHVKQATKIDAIATEVREFLGVDLDEQFSWKGVETALQKWREAFERVGIYVFKEAFKAEDYFGFCLYDEEFPIIFVNNTSTKTRQIFTLFHELGHLIFNTSGIDYRNDMFVDNLGSKEKRIEIICNQLAAKVLVPDSKLDEFLKRSEPNRQTAEVLANTFNVSREMIYRKMLDRGLVSRVEYFAATVIWNNQQVKGVGGGSFYNTQWVYLGRNYIDLAFSRYYQQRFDDVRLAEYLNVKPKHLPRFETKLEGSR
jgi:Zn-dependent peptidase ImmA (M78 family)/transcriptional regulator with XRE-family HTH domain